ncbi:hypothetical protein ACTFIY_000006 [Dictyostelium cf. discoideum]
MPLGLSTVDTYLYNIVMTLLLRNQTDIVNDPFITRKTHSGDSVFINNEGEQLEVNHINNIVLSTLLKSGIDITRFKSHSTRFAMASLMLSNKVPFHVVKKMGCWKSKDTVYTFYDKRSIGEKSGGFLNTVVQIS